MSKVYIVNENKHNFRGVEEYGEVIYITQGFINLGDMDTLAYNMQPTLEEIEEADYIVLTGPISVNIIIGHYLLKKFGKITILAWDKRVPGYRPQVIREDFIK